MTDERGPVEFRSAAELGVRWPDRVIELVAMPYDVDAGVVVHGRSVIESCAPGAFDGCERRANRVKVEPWTTTRSAPSAVRSLCTPHAPRAWSPSCASRRPTLGDETLGPRR